MRLLVAALGTILVPAGFHLGVSPASAQDCAPHCVQPQAPTDKICNFNGGDLCGGVVGTVTSCPGACEEGICTEGAGYVVVGDDDMFSSEALEIELQVTLSRLPQPGETATGLVTKYRGHSPGESEWALFVEKQAVWVLCGDGSLCISSSPGAVQIGTPYCVRAILLGASAELWVNGALVASGPINRNPANTATPVVIGNSFQPGHGNPFFGTLDEVRIGVHVPTIGAVVDFDPDTLNPKSKGQSVTSYVELPDGFSVSDIDLASVRLNDVVPAEPAPSAVGDHDGDGRADLMVKFSRQAVIQLLPPGDHVPVVISGTVGTVHFSGTDFIRVLSGS